jgi:hypothetical protein
MSQIELWSVNPPDKWWCIKIKLSDPSVEITESLLEEKETGEISFTVDAKTKRFMR